MSERDDERPRKVQRDSVGSADLMTDGQVDVNKVKQLSDKVQQVPLLHSPPTPTLFF